MQGSVRAYWRAVALLALAIPLTIPQQVAAQAGAGLVLRSSHRKLQRGAAAPPPAPPPAVPPLHGLRPQAMLTLPSMPPLRTRNAAVWTDPLVPGPTNGGLFPTFFEAYGQRHVYQLAAAPVGTVVSFAALHCS
jgi:hypothetical protein